MITYPSANLGLSFAILTRVEPDFHDTEAAGRHDLASFSVEYVHKYLLQLGHSRSELGHVPVTLRSRCRRGSVSTGVNWRWLGRILLSSKDRS